MQSLKIKLERNIWITRKCRINASERLLDRARYIEVLNVYYSIFVISLSLISLTEHNDMLSMISLICSIALTISIIYANTAGYRERSFSLKQDYIELQLLLDRLTCIDDTDTEAIKSISDQYAELLKSSENHVQMDLYRLKDHSSDKEMMLSSSEKRNYYLRLVWEWFWKFFWFVFPVLILVAFWTYFEVTK